MLNVIMWVVIYLVVGYPFALVGIRWDARHSARLTERQKNYPPERRFACEPIGPEGMVIMHLGWPITAVCSFVWLVFTVGTKVKARLSGAASTFFYRLYRVG